MRRPGLTLVVALASGLCVGAGAHAQEDPKEIKPPEMIESVLRSLEAPYLSDVERARLRVFHGLWKDSDLADPALRAQAALMLGVFDDPVFDDPACPPIDRADALLCRGDLGAALAIASASEGPRAARIEAESLAGLGRFDDARDAIDVLIGSLGGGAGESLGDPQQITELVRALMLQADLRGEPAEHYTEMLQLLARVHQDLDRGYWPALVEESRLLLDKHNAKDGQQAGVDALARNPMCAEAWFLLGAWAVEAMNYERAIGIADRLDALARRLGADDTATSPNADIIRAKAAIRQNDPDAALMALTPTLARFPHMRPALAIRCAADGLSYDQQVLEKSLAEYDELSPGSPDALYEAGAALAERRQYDIAEDLYRRASARQPNWPEPIIDLGLLFMQVGKDPDALETLTRATELDPFNTRAANSLTLVKDVIGFDRIETDHFILKYQPGVDGVMAREMPELLEEMYRVVTGAMKFEPEHKTIIELMPDHASFAVRITGNSDVYTMAASTGPLLAMEAPKIGKGHLAIYDWQRVVRHEYTHTVTLAKTNNRIPHWFTEAAAVWMERGPRDYTRCKLLAGALASDELFSFGDLSLAFVRPKGPNDRPLAYAQSEWMYEYMVERWGEDAPLRLMEGYAAGKREPQLVQEVLGVSTTQFMEEFKEWARAQVRAWGMGAEPSLEALRIKETLADDELRDGVIKALKEFALESGIRATSGAFPAQFEPTLVSMTPELVEYWFAMYPDHPDVVELMLRVRLSETDGEANEDLAPLLERYAELRPVDPLPHRVLARMYLKTGRGAQAIPHLEFLDVREVWADTYAIELAKLYGEAREWNKATAKAERATHISPFDPANREVAARIAIGRKDFDTAERHLKALIELEPNQKVHIQRLEALQKMRAGG